MALYTWSTDFSNKRNQIIKKGLITDAQITAFQAKINGYCPSHNGSNTSKSCSGDTGCSTNDSYSTYTVCGCGNDSTDSAISSNGTKWCTSN